MMSDFRFAVRQWLKDPVFAAVTVMTLALGIGANTALFSVIHGVLLRPLPFKEPERLVTLWEGNPGNGVEQQAVSPPTFSDWREQSESFEGLAFWTGPFDYNFATPGGYERVKATYGSSGLFRLLRVAPMLGRGFLDEEDRKEGPQTAVISHRLWQERYDGDPAVLGRSLTVDTFGRRTYTIVGVMPPGFGFPDDSELWLAAGWNGLPLDRRSGHWLSVLGRLKPGFTLAQARSEMNAIQAGIFRQQHSGAQVGSEVSVVPLLQQMVGRNTRAALWVLWGAVAGVLLIACANVANLLLARAASRRREIALRMAVGAGRWRVMRQMMAESLVLGLLGGALGAVLGWWALRALMAASPTHIPRLAEVSMDGAALAFTAGAAVLTALIFGVAPAWQSSRPDLEVVLKEGSRGTTGGHSTSRLRSGLVVVEMALALLLLVGAGLMLQTFARLMAADRGFRTAGVLTAELDFSVEGFTTWIRPTETRPQVRLHELLERVRQLPGVHSASAAYRFLRLDNRPPAQPLAIFGRPAGVGAQRPMAEPNAVTPGYLRTLGIGLVRGRDFSESDRLESPGVALVNEAFVRRYFPDEDPLGKHVTMVSEPGPLGSKDRVGLPVWSEIVGVVRDVKSLSTSPEATPEVYRPYWQWPMQNPTLYVHASGEGASLVNALRREIQEVIPNLPDPRFRELTARLDESVAEPRFLAVLLSLFGGLALLLAAFGIYGVMAYSVAQRQFEIGVRMALGAQRRNIASLIVGHGLRLAGIGVGIGLAGSLAVTRVLGSLLYGVTPADPATLLGVSSLLMVVAVLACWIPARLAAHTNVLAALQKP